MRGIFLCEYVWGIGHLMRAMRICRRLVEEFDIEFIQGGMPVELPSIDSTRFHLHTLPLLDKKILEKVSHDPLATIDMAQTIAKRRMAFKKIVKGPFDFFMTDSFPFSKLMLRQEILEVIGMVKARNPRAAIISSYKGVEHDLYQNLLPEQQENFLQNEQHTIQLLDTYYDKVFVHTDPALIRVEETMNLPQRLLPKLHYTGFICDPCDSLPNVPRERRILVSAGGGFFGEHLIKAAIETARFFPDIHFLIVTGPYAHFDSDSAPNITIVDFVQDFDRELQRSALSISMAGSTLINLYRTRTPALIYPSEKSWDQQFLARKFAELGAVSILGEEDLSAEKMAERIRGALAQSYPQVLPSIDLNGVENTCAQLKKMLLM